MLQYRQGRPNAFAGIMAAGIAELIRQPRASPPDMSRSR